MIIVMLMDMLLQIIMKITFITMPSQVTTSTREWQLSTELVTNQWQDIVMTWKKEEGLMLYVNGAFRDSLKEGTETSLVPNKQARLTIGRKSGNPPFKYTRYIFCLDFAELVSISFQGGFTFSLFAA